ncbi:MAG: hypothetical protein J5865_04255 [Lachnospiraceae bacterium]|nr:hypothetical protein [Lachnospiraceae bacterium]
MSTLQELVRYCTDEHQLGVLLLTGEWGCGKTYLIDKDLTEALSKTHFIVRVSLLGIDSIDALNSAVRKQWLQVCTPFLGKLKSEAERVKSRGSMVTALANVMASLNPLGGSIASALVAVDPLDYIPLDPVVEDRHDEKTEKRVVLVFDDLDRSRLDLHSLVGTITEYCENKGFTTIVVAEEEFVKTARQADPAIYKMLKDKTIAHTVRCIPDYRKIIHDIIAQPKWEDPEYAEYLSKNEQGLYDIFVSGPVDPKSGVDKYHNFRSLACALQEFSRLYEIMKEQNIQNTDPYLFSFVAYILITRNGIRKNGRPCFDFEEEDIRKLYPGYSSEALPECIRMWIEYGIWDDAAIREFISSLS